jgi:predicted RNA methylase
MASAPEMPDVDLPLTIEQIRRGLAVTDRAFNRIYPEEIRRQSAQFWTPIIVARRAAAQLTATGATRILDVGAGVGKLCILGALTTPATFTGVEHRAHLVEIGRAAIHALGIPRAHLLHGTLASVDFDAYDGFYFYNPFEENVFSPEKRLDESVPLSEERRRADVALVEQALARAKVGTRVVTFYGFGGQMPATYRALPEETRGTAFLRLWEQTEGELPA